MTALAPADAGRAILARVVVALAPYLDELILVGGWAHRLYPLDRRSGATELEALVTLDADFATPESLRQRAKPIDVLLEEVGFEEHLGGDCSPPITRYVLKTAGADFDVEFVTPLRGGEVKRGKPPNVTLAVAGVTAQRLRYVDLLQQNPWTVELSRGSWLSGRAERAPPAHSQPGELHRPEDAGARPAHEHREANQGRPLHPRHHLAIQLCARRALHRSGAPLPDALHPGLTGKLREKYAAIFGPRSLYLGPAAELARATGRRDPPTPDALAAVCKTAFPLVFDAAL